MVNKSALAVLAVIVFVSMSVGVLIGMQLDPGMVEAGPGNATSTPDGAGTATPAPTATATDSTLTPIPARRFDPDLIAESVRSRINQERQAEGLDTLETGTSLAGTLDAMALEHSTAMADAGRVAHVVDGVNSADRYRDHDVFETCKFQSSTGGYIVDASDGTLEAVGRTTVGQSYTSGGETRFNEDEGQAAAAVVEGWVADSDARETLLLQNAERLGVGVEVTQSGDVYVTANLC